VRAALVQRHGEEAHGVLEVQVGVVADPGEFELVEAQQVHGFAIAVALDEFDRPLQRLGHEVAPFAEQAVLVVEEGRRHADADFFARRARLARKADQAGGSEAAGLKQPLATVTVW
jgi:hypothetical protein